MSLIHDISKNFCKDGTRDPHWGKIISSVVVTVALIVVVILNNSRLERRSKERAANRRYTIGTTGTRHHNIKSSKPTVEFYYKVLGKMYEGNQAIDAQYENTAISNGGRYYVEFSSKDPSNSVLLLGHPIPISLQQAPDSGWVNFVEN